MACIIVVGVSSALTQVFVSDQFYHNIVRYGAITLHAFSSGDTVLSDVNYSCGVVYQVVVITAVLYLVALFSTFCQFCFMASMRV